MDERRSRSASLREGGGSAIAETEGVLTPDAANTVRWLTRRPVEFARLLGFDKLTELHNGWIADMVCGSADTTLQSHRGSYKTTCVSVALAILMMLRPALRILFMRKTDADIKEVVLQVRRILESDPARTVVHTLYGVELTLTTAAASELSTNLRTDLRGASQLVGLGSGGSVTGKHFDRIFTDDIVNIQDRLSRAERERVCVLYQELQNVKNRGGRIVNTGTPWHPDDAFSLMPPPVRYDCRATGLIDPAALAALRESMTPALFAANYELRHIPSDGGLFVAPETGADPALIRDGIAHVDAAFGGADTTAFTVCRRVGDTYYLYGRVWQRHVEDVSDEMLALCRTHAVGRLYCEDNADKGYLARALRRRGARVVSYHESTNKYHKITTYLRAAWRQIRFVEGTDEEYIRQIVEYTEDAAHDDAPDSAASAVRILWNAHPAPTRPSRTRVAVTPRDMQGGM